MQLNLLLVRFNLVKDLFLQFALLSKRGIKVGLETRHLIRGHLLNLDFLGLKLRLGLLQLLVEGLDGALIELGLACQFGLVLGLDLA